MSFTEFASLSLYCPPMPIYRHGPGLRRTAAEPMQATITWGDGRGLFLPSVVIPPAEVRRQHLLHWIVDACRGEGGRDGWYLIVDLPPEDVLFDLAAWTMVAQAMDAGVMLTDAAGRAWQGSVRFPDCKTDLLAHPALAEAVTALGGLQQLK